jgi:CheY-like chemotaxis protein
MVAGFVKQSGGTLKIQSTEGRGTAIEICLPLAPALEAANTALLPVAPIRAAAPRVASIGKYKILIVDDEPAIADLVRAWAKDQGHTAVSVSSADDAIALLAVKSFDAMLSDIMMPGQLDGIGLAQQASVLYPKMRILLMSGYSKETATNRADIPWPLLVKPFSKADFHAAMEAAYGVPGLSQLAELSV